jgi:hypothetical protein
MRRLNTITKFPSRVLWILCILSGRKGLRRDCGGEITVAGHTDPEPIKCWFLYGRPRL